MPDRKPLGPRPQEPYKTIGERVVAWRKYRGYERPDFAEATGIPYPTLAGIENGDQKGSTRLHVIAAKLQINVNYLESGKGEPEDLSWRPEPALPEEWSFLEELKDRISGYSDIERDVVHLSLLKAIQKIENGRKQIKSKKQEENHENKDQSRRAGRRG